MDIHPQLLLEVGAAIDTLGGGGTLGTRSLGHQGPLHPHRPGVAPHNLPTSALPPSEVSGHECSGCCMCPVRDWVAACAQ